MTTLAESSTRVLERIAGTADLCVLKPKELDCLASAHDLVENSHALTALCYADGLLRARLGTCVEDNVRVGGAGQGLCHALAEVGLQRPFRALGLPREFPPYDTRAEILRRHRLDAADIARAIAAQLDQGAA